jgi:hypothetical protein
MHGRRDFFHFSLSLLAGTALYTRRYIESVPHSSCCLGAARGPVVSMVHGYVGTVIIIMYNTPTPVVALVVVVVKSSSLFEKEGVRYRDGVCLFWCERPSLTITNPIALPVETSRCRAAIVSVVRFCVFINFFFFFFCRRRQLFLLTSLYFDRASYRRSVL